MPMNQEVIPRGRGLLAGIWPNQFPALQGFYLGFACGKINIPGPLWDMVANDSCIMAKGTLQCTYKCSGFPSCVDILCVNDERCTRCKSCDTLVVTWPDIQNEPRDVSPTWSRVLGGSLYSIDGTQTDYVIPNPAWFGWRHYRLHSTQRHRYERFPMPAAATSY